MTHLHLITSANNTGFRGTALTLAIIFYVLAIVLAVILYVAQWKMFEKAGVKGWKAIVPLYNYYTQFRIAGESGWWVIGLLIPIINIYAVVLMILGIAKSFKKGTLFAVLGLLLFSPIGYLILGFGKSSYSGELHK